MSTVEEIRLLKYKLFKKEEKRAAEIVAIGIMGIIGVVLIIGFAIVTYQTAFDNMHSRIHISETNTSEHTHHEEIVK